MDRSTGAFREGLQPGGETYDQVMDRARGFLDSLRPEPDRRVIAVSHGVLGRLMRGAYAGLEAIRKFMHQNPSKLDPREYLKPAKEAAKAIVKQRFSQFGCEGQASKIKPVAMSAMAAMYAAGQLAQTVR